MPNLEEIILRAIKATVLNEKDLINIEKQFFKEKKINRPLLNFYQLSPIYQKLVLEGKIKPYPPLEKILIKTKIRSLSGIVSVTLITKPYPCPGNCLYCPNDPQMPKSYLPDEPACSRAIKLNFDPYLQITNRIKALRINGHPTDKIELIILGGTWSFYPKRYRNWFIKRAFDGANKKNSPTLYLSQKTNEKAKNRIIGITIETRPDYISYSEIKHLRTLGITRVELGVQSIYNEVLQLNKREITSFQIAQATKMLKNAGFKVTYHMMLNLYGSDIKKDEKMFEELFSNQDFQPDQLKIYPCVVLKNTQLYNLYKNKEYHPYTNKELVDLLIRIKQKIPPYVRIVRIIRDIPSYNIIAGNKISNLRQLIQEKMEKEGKVCNCIRCREPKDEIINFKNVKLIRREYLASGGKEIFLSFEDTKLNKILAFLRLRITNEWSIKSLKNCAIVRELHSYGKLAPLDKKTNVQHRGLGKKLMKEAEEIVKKETKLKKIAVISGVGVREYYRQLGYRLFDTYMVKTIK